MKIAIVGSQGKSFNEYQKKCAVELIELIIVSWSDTAEWRDNDYLTIVSGGEPTGVDSWAEKAAIERCCPREIHLPESRDWEGYKARNILIAESCASLYAIRSRNSKTYGSGWTADYAEKIGKKVFRYYV